MRATEAVCYPAPQLADGRPFGPGGKVQLPQPPASLTDDRFERTVDIIFTPPDAKKKKKTAQRQ